MAKGGVPRKHSSGHASDRPTEAPQSRPAARKSGTRTKARAEAAAPPAGERIRVAIVGGGCAGMAAAWELSKRPGYDVHLYERSWRLGGKGASGRGDDGRIREHGLHIWLGFYENAFRMMRECYAEVEARGWGPDVAKPPGERLPHGSIDEAFFAESHIGVGCENRAGEWEMWSGHLPPMAGRPGEPLDEHSNPFTLPRYLARCLALVKTLMVSMIEPADTNAPGDPRPNRRSAFDEKVEGDFSLNALRSPSVLVERMAAMLRAGVLTSAAGLLQGVIILEKWLESFRVAPAADSSLLEFFEAVAVQTRRLLRDLVAVDERLRFKTHLVDLVMTIAVGLYRDRVLFDPRGLDAINNIDYCDWLKKHGATYESVDSSFMTGIYELVFAYQDGKRSLAAGVALRGALRMFFTYRGAMFFRLRSGMGDVVFSPLYKVLCGAADAPGRPPHSPVTFHFLHSLRSIAFDLTDPDRRRVARLAFTTPGDPAKIDACSREALDHFGCWPDTDRLFAGALDPAGDPPRELQHVADTDFDVVIFALGVDDFVAACEQGVREDGGDDLFVLPQWKAMRTHVKTVATKAAQVWLSKDLDELGWYRGPGLISALGSPFGTWADMTHLLASERSWRAARANDGKAPAPPADGVRSVAAFCSVLPERVVQRSPDADALRGSVEADLRDMLRSGARRLWPKAFDDDGATAQDLLVPGGAEYPLSGQHVQANVAGSERYTLALPGSIDHRVSPLDRSILNMTIAGDWTACGIDAGCVEAAVMSGMLAAHAVTGRAPALEDIVGYHHP